GNNFSLLPAHRSIGRLGVPRFGWRGSAAARSSLAESLRTCLRTPRAFALLTAGTAQLPKIVTSIAGLWDTGRCDDTWSHAPKRRFWMTPPNSIQHRSGWLPQSQPRPYFAQRAVASAARRSGAGGNGNARDVTPVQTQLGRHAGR